MKYCIVKKTQRGRMYYHSTVEGQTRFRPSIREAKSFHSPNAALKTALKYLEKANFSIIDEESKVIYSVRNGQVVKQVAKGYYLTDNDKLRKKRGPESGRRYSSPEAYFLVHGKTGDTFLSLKEAKNLTAAATYYQRHITTKVYLLIDPNPNSVSTQVCQMTLIQ